jgi:hypothetical protein
MKEQLVPMYRDVPTPVQNAIHSLQTACANWTAAVPKVVEDINRPPAISSQANDAVTICSFVTSPDPWRGLDHELELAGMLLLMVIMVLGLFVWLSRIYRLPRFLFRLMAGGVRRLRGCFVHG